MDEETRPHSSEEGTTVRAATEKERSSFEARGSGGGCRERFVCQSRAQTLCRFSTSSKSGPPAGMMCSRACGGREARRMGGRRCMEWRPGAWGEVGFAKRCFRLREMTDGGDGGKGEWVLPARLNLGQQSPRSLIEIDGLSTAGEVGQGQWTGQVAASTRLVSDAPCMLGCQSIRDRLEQARRPRETVIAIPDLSL